MIRINFILGLLLLTLGCNGPVQKSNGVSDSVTDTLGTVSIEEGNATESHYLVPDSIAKLFHVDYYPTNKMKYYYTRKEIMGELMNVFFDYMDIDRFLINGKFSHYIPYDTLISKMGKPDSYDRIEEMGYTNYKYDGLEFSMHDFDSMVYCEMIYLKGGKNFIEYDSLRFDFKTRITDFVELYPLSCLNVEKDRLFNNVEYDWIRFEPKGDHLRDDQHIFLFEDGLLSYYLYFDGDD